MAIEPTKEQQAACDFFVTGKDLALIAGAGTGKTSTLALMSRATARQGLYIAFNRTTADDARQRFPRNVECRTAHSIAFAAVGRPYRNRMNASRIPARETARLLGITHELDVGSLFITSAHQARLVMNMIRRFCYQRDRQVMAGHMERINGLDIAAHEYLAGALLPYAIKAWEDIQNPDGKLRFEHDHYMKMWAMTGPILHAEFILLDEAQDTNPVMEEVFLSQRAQRICVGDPAQQIYAWRHAQDVMTGFPAEHLWLTRSFRFGPKIAEVANRWLRRAGHEMVLVGCGSIDSQIGPAHDTDAVLCRGNADVMHEIFAFLEQGTPVALRGGSAELRKIARAAQELKAGRRTSHPELFLFASWGEVQEYVQYDQAGQDLKAIVKLIDKHGPEAIIHATERLSDEKSAKVTVSTVHKAKGHEWVSVRIGHGFAPPPVDSNGIQAPLSEGEARLIYVAVSRARQFLDPSGVNWIDDYEKTVGRDEQNGVIAGIPMVQLSLTSQLKYITSPMSQFMKAYLPNSQELVRDYRQRIGQFPPPIQLSDVRYPNWAALGHTIDYRLRLLLNRPLGPAVYWGVMAVGNGLLSESWPSETLAVMYAIGSELLSTVDGLLAYPDAWPDDAVTRLCFVASFYEDIYRCGKLRLGSLLTEVRPWTRLNDLIAAVPGYVIADIRQQLDLADRVFAPFRALPIEARICGPIFTGSYDIGGADADFIVNGCLLDCKATIRPARLGREEIYQLAGYLLLDYQDQFAITHLGLYLSRQGHFVVWTVDEFLQRLGATLPLSELRYRLRNHLHESSRNEVIQGCQTNPSKFSLDHIEGLRIAMAAGTIQTARRG